MDADDLIATLNLVPHPEGGHYRQTWIEDAGTAIYFLLKAGELSSRHRVHARVEIWHFYDGAPLELSINEQARGDDEVRTVRLGTTCARGNALRLSFLPVCGSARKVSEIGRSSAVPSRRR